MSRRHKPGQHNPGKRWTVITRGQRSGQTYVPAQAWTFRERKRAKSFARNIQGARVSGPRSRGPLWWLGVLVAVALVLLGLVVIAGGPR